MYLLLVILIACIAQIEARVCSFDTSPCFDNQTYSFYVCGWPLSKGECTVDVAQTFLTGTFDSTNSTFSDGVITYDYFEDCGDFEMDDPGFLGSLAFNESTDPIDCYGLYGSVRADNVDYGQFIGEIFVETPAPTMAPTMGETLPVEESCDFDKLVEEMDCPDLTDCHRGNWTLNFCTYDCTPGVELNCLAALAGVTWDVTLDWGLGLLWSDGAYHEYTMGCRTWEVPDLDIKGYFTRKDKEDGLCDIMPSGTWDGKAFSAFKTSDIPGEPEDSLNGLQLYLAIGGALCLTIIGILVYSLFKKFYEAKSNKAVATEVYELPDNPPRDIPPPYEPYYEPYYQPTLDANGAMQVQQPGSNNMPHQQQPGDVGALGPIPEHSQIMNAINGGSVVHMPPVHPIDPSREM
mmetsp:Transcript_14417/g.21397  ORF Transcript_14417/g.21397 Transcript_14417/m.21397 type:complete len:405 (+) Transcript_14417:123-1337(+)